MDKAAQAKSWMNHPDHSVLWFIRQLRNLKVLGVITTGAELQGIISNQRKSHCAYKQFVSFNYQCGLYLLQTFLKYRTYDVIIQNLLLITSLANHPLVEIYLCTSSLPTRDLTLYTILYPGSFTKHFPM